MDSLNGMHPERYETRGIWTRKEAPRYARRRTLYTRICSLVYDQWDASLRDVTRRLWTKDAEGYL